jgi:hypothetical protein
VQQSPACRRGTGRDDHHNDDHGELRYRGEDERLVDVAPARVTQARAQRDEPGQEEHREAGGEGQGGIDHQQRLPHDAAPDGQHDERCQAEQDRARHEVDAP